MNRTTTDLLDRQPPMDLQAELGVIGSCLIDSFLIKRCSLWVQPEEFYDDANRIIYQTMIDMDAEGLPIELIILTSRLRGAGDWEKIGGAAYLAKCGDSVAGPWHCKYYANIVRTHAITRRIITTGMNIVKDAYEADPRDVPDLANRAVTRMARATEAQFIKVLPADDFLRLKDNLVERAEQTGDQRTGAVSTWFPELDAKLGGLFHSELTILAARPSMGKTSLACQIAMNAAILGGQGVVLASLEMSDEELAQRMICQKSGASFYRIRTGQADPSDLWMMDAAAEDLAAAPLTIVDEPDMNVNQIRAVSIEAKQRHGLGMIVIDYLQLLGWDGDPRKRRNEVVDEITKQVKLLARELDVPVVCLAQLSRATEQEKSHRPKLSHLRESGAIEQHADVVTFVHRPEYYEPNNSDLKGKAEIIVGKNRNGPTGIVNLRWTADSLVFSSPSQEDPDEGMWDEEQQDLDF